jgi:hypothetical protein
MFLYCVTINIEKFINFKEITHVMINVGLYYKVKERS